MLHKGFLLPSNRQWIFFPLSTKKFPVRKQGLTQDFTVYTVCEIDNQTLLIQTFGRHYKHVTKLHLNLI